jgi:tRNA-binding EMAP/Myf-like protein
MSGISLLFLTYSNITHIEKFNSLFENCNVYIHPKYPEQLNSTLKKYVIPNLVETKWGDKSIVNATLELLKTAYKNVKNNWFILCSEDIYPLINYDELNTYLASQSYSIFDVMDSKTNKTSQFWALKRDDVSIILSNKDKWNRIMSNVPNKKAVDELFFLNLLKENDRSYKFTNSKFCYVKWFRNIESKHPATFNCLLDVDETEITRNRSCFLRKTYPTFKNVVCPKKDLSILVTYGSESAKDVGQFISNFEDIANIFILSLVNSVDNEQLTNNCCQTYYTFWNDIENATRVIKEQFTGDLIITSEKFDLNNLKELLKGGKLSDDNSNTIDINFDVNNVDWIALKEDNSDDVELKEDQGDDVKEDQETNVETNEEVKGEKEVILKLGDIILISDPTNEILNDNVFLIEYIDPKKIKLINSESFEKTVLPISSEGVIGDGNIKMIKVISSNPESGYARQNDLLPGTWINIYFGGDIPTVITGEITNIEEDMIEIRTTDKDTIFINFNYQGIPEDLPIETFEIRPAIESPKSEEMNADELVEIGEDDDYKVADEPVKISKNEVKTKIQNMFFDMDDLEFGDVVKVEEYVNIDKDKYRYNIDVQTNDLLEEMISGIPNTQRTNNVLNNIHIMITRFLQLRQMSSTFDVNKNVTGVINRTAEDRPLAEQLAEFKNNLYWIMMVAKNVKKLYEADAITFGRHDDTEFIDESKNLLEMDSLFKKYRANETVEGENKYKQLYYSLDSYLTPFYSLNPGSVEDVFTKPNGVIIEADVESNINAIIDNLGSLYSTVMSKSESVTKRFVIQRYNLGQDTLHAETFKGKFLRTHKVKITNNDPISINSIITLPEPTVRFSQINLPGSNLLVKANLNLHFLNYWQLLKQKTSMTDIVIDGLDNEIEYDDTNFVDNIKQYMLDLTEYEKPTQLTNLDIYKIFLRTIIPKIKILFKLVQKYIKGRLSLVDVVKYLEPFLIYPIDLTYTQYQNINSFIYDKIKEYNRTFKEYSIVFSSLRNWKGMPTNSNNKSQYIFKNPLFDLLQPPEMKGNNSEEMVNEIHMYEELKSKVFDDYGFSDTAHMERSGSEFLKRVTVADFGNLYNTAVALTNIKLMYPTELSSVFDMDKNKLKNIIDEDKQNDKCSTFIIAKKYYSVEALKEDDNKLIYFDKEFDTTNYDLIDTQYRKQRDNLSTDDLILYITEDLKKKAKLDDISAEYMATTLVTQAKKVREGDYALLVNTNESKDFPETLEYYVRNNDIWVLNKDVDPNSFIKSNDILCNIDYNCIYNPAEKREEAKCESTEVSKDQIVNNALKQIIDQFDKNYEISKNELNTLINKKLDYFSKSFDRLQEIRRKQFLKYNNQQYEIGLLVDSEINGRVISPYNKLKNLIMGQNDFVKKQIDIIQFVSLYCREGDPELPNIQDGEMESSWWLYCKKTDTKLLPKFVYILADTFITKNSEYDNVLNDLKRRIGKVSDDGDSWVDENSGEVICFIDLDTEEGYTDGFMNKTRDVIEKDVGEVMLEKQQDKKNRRLSPEGELVSNVINILSNNMGINIEQSREFIIKVVTELMNDVKVIEKEPSYRKREEESVKKGKKLPSYTTVYSSTLIYLTLGMYLIGIQTSIPSLKTRRTAPGCVRSFSGFPFEGEGDDSGLNYVACVALKSRDSTTMPWNALPRNEEKVAMTLKSFIIRYLLPYSEVDQKIKEKVEYLLFNPEESIPDEYNLEKWTNFLPPLRRFHVNHLENVTDGFTEELQNELYTGNYRQLEKLLVIDSKIISYSLAIQESIQKLVEKKNLLLKAGGQFFMDNSCCNEQGNNRMTCLQYFINEDSSIEAYNNVVNSLTSLVRDIKLLTESAIMLSDVNTKNIFPMVSNEFNEETIYYAFITLCKFQSTIPLSEELASVCVDKPDYLKKMDSIQEKIGKLKRDGRHYTKDQFLRLFQIVSRNNIIRLSLSSKNASCVDSLKKLLSILDSENNDAVPKALTQKLEMLTESYDVTLQEDTKEMRDVKNYLQVTIDLMRKDVIDFLKTKGKLGTVELKNLTRFLTDLSVWEYDKNPRNVDTKISDDGLYNCVTFYKNFISLFSVVFPSMIKNQKLQSIEPPNYWGLSKIHSNDVKEMVSSFYKPIEKFYGNNTINNVLNEIISKTRGIYLLSNNTPILTNIKIGEKEVYSVFDKRTTILLYEYYFLSILSDYMNLTKDPSMVTRMLITPDKDENDIYSADFLVEQQMRFTESEQEFIEGDVMKLKQDVAKLLIAYLNIMMRSKKTVNVSYNDVEDKIFKLKEAEKYNFTDELKDKTDEARALDNIMKMLKLGPIYSIGLSKGLREYDPDNFDRDKEIAEKVYNIQNKLKRNNNGVDADLDVDDALDEENAQYEIDMDIAMDMNMSDDYNDGDPWGDERENMEDYD